jgi:hypothetical protein
MKSLMTDHQDSQHLSSSYCRTFLSFYTLAQLTLNASTAIGMFVSSDATDRRSERTSYERGIESEQEKIVPGFTDISLGGGGHRGRLYRNKGLPDTPSSQPGDPLARVSAQMSE